MSVERHKIKRNDRTRFALLLVAMFSCSAVNASDTGVVEPSLERAIEKLTDTRDYKEHEKQYQILQRLNDVVSNALNPLRSAVKEFSFYLCNNNADPVTMTWNGLIGSQNLLIPSIKVEAALKARFNNRQVVLYVVESGRERELASVAEDKLDSPDLVKAVQSLLQPPLTAKIDSYVSKVQ